MTLVYLLLGVGFVLPVGRIAALMVRDGANARVEADIARILAPLPEERGSLLPEDFYATWPQRQTPSDLPPREFLVVAADRVGGHRAPEPVEELSTTGQFWAIVEDFADLTQPCAHCTTPEDGEPAHAGCPGCACPCGLAVGV